MGKPHFEPGEDQESDRLLNQLDEKRRIEEARIPGVRTVLVVLSSAAMAFDVDSLRQKILLSYPDAAVFFRSTSGKPIGVASPQSVDLLIDLTGPRQRQRWFMSRSLRKLARFAVGRNAGFFRKKIYDRIFDEKENSVASSLPKDLFEKERMVQRHVLELAGVTVQPIGETTRDLGNSIALSLPPIAGFPRSSSGSGGNF